MINSSEVTTPRLARTSLSGVAVAPLFILADLADALLRRDYNPLRHWVSHLALGPMGWVGATTLVVTAGLLAHHAFVLWSMRGFAGRAHAYPGVLIFAAVCLFAAAVFPIEPSLGFPPDALPRHDLAGVIHDIVGPLAVLSLAAAAGLSRPFETRLSSGKDTSRGGMAVCLASVTAFASCTVLVWLDYSGAWPGAPSGALERVSIYLPLIWVSRVAWRLRRGSVTTR